MPITRRINRRKRFIRKTRRQKGGLFTLFKRKTPLSSAPVEPPVQLKSEDATLFNQLTELWGNRETMYFIRDTGRQYIEALRKEQNTGKPVKVPELSPVVLQLIGLTNKFGGIFTSLKAEISKDLQEIKNTSGLTDNGLEEQGKALLETVEEDEEDNATQNALVASVDKQQRNFLKKSETDLCRPEPTNIDSGYIPCDNTGNPYYNDAVTGNIYGGEEGTGIIETFIKRYEFHKSVDLHYPLKSETRVIGYKLGLFSKTIRILLAAAKMGITLVGSLATFGVGGGIIYSMLGVLQKLVINTAGIDSYLNTNKECIQLMKPYKLWDDPKLYSVMLLLARNIKNDPYKIQAIPGYHIKYIKNAETDETEFTEFRSTNPESGCSNAKEILNMIFYTSKFKKVQLAKLVATQLHAVIVDSASVIRSSRNDGAIKKIKRSFSAKNSQPFTPTTDSDLIDLNPILSP